MSHIPDPPETAEPPVDRTISPVGQRRVFRAPRTAVLSIVGLACGGGVMLAASLGDNRPSSPAAERMGPAKQVVRYEPTEASERSPPFESEPDRLAWDEPGGEAATVPSQAQGEIAGRNAPGPEASTPSPLVVYRSPGPLQATTAQKQGRQESRPGEVATARVSDGSSPVEEPIGRAAATALDEHDRSYMLLAGAVVPCILQTALDSSRPGYASCLLTRDVLSENGAVVLLEKGTRVFGGYEATMARGDQRLLIQWVRAVTPTGVKVTIDSPAADALGRAGLAGELDTRFWARFGGAVLLSMIDQVAVASQSSDGQVWVSPSQAPVVALEDSIDLPPRLWAPQGSEVTIFVTQDLDFSDVYQLTLR